MNRMKAYKKKVILGLSIIVWILILYPFLKHRYDIQHDIRRLKQQQIELKANLGELTQTDLLQETSNLSEQLKQNQKRVPPLLTEEQVLYQLEALKASSNIQFLQVTFNQEENPYIDNPIQTMLKLQRIGIDFIGDEEDIQGFLKNILGQELAIGIEDISLDWQEYSGTKMKGYITLLFYSHKFIEDEPSND